MSSVAEPTPHDLQAEIERLEAETCQLADERDTARAEAKQLRAELDERKRLSTSPTRDDATGLETLCALLHAAGTADPNVIKDVAWRTFGLIRAWREQGDERDRLAEQVRALAKSARGWLLCDVHLHSDNQPDCAGCRDRRLAQDALNTYAPEVPE